MNHRKRHTLQSSPPQASSNYCTSRRSHSDERCVSFDAGRSSVSKERVFGNKAKKNSLHLFAPCMCVCVCINCFDSTCYYSSNWTKQAALHSIEQHRIESSRIESIDPQYPRASGEEGIESIEIGIGIEIGALKETRKRRDRPDIAIWFVAIWFPFLFPFPFLFQASAA